MGRQRTPSEPVRDLYSLLCNHTWLRVAHHCTSIPTRDEKRRALTDATMSTIQWGRRGQPGHASARRSKPKPLNPCLSAGCTSPKPMERRGHLGIPTIDDRIVQEALRMLLEPIWEADFSNRSYGFRPNRSTYDAIAYLEQPPRRTRGSQLPMDHRGRHSELL